MQAFEEKNSMSLEKWKELVHRVKVDRPVEAAQLLLELRGERPSTKRVNQVVRRLVVERESIYKMRRESGYETKEIAEEILQNVEDWLDSEGDNDD